MDIAFRSQKSAAIEVRDLHVRLGGNPVLRGVNLRIEAGQMVALIGPNGSGKTTLLRCLLGLQKPDSGSVRLLQEGPPNPALLKRMGYVPQRLQLDPSFMLTVREFLAIRRPLTAGWFWRPSRQIDALLHEAVGEMDVTRLLDRPVAGLSGGQLQRVLICSSLLNEPELLLLDEPMAALDRGLREHTRNELKRLHRELGTTFVLVTHDQEEALALADRVALLDRGRLAQDGSPEDLYERPASLAVARFVGRINLIEGRTSDGGTVEIPGLGAIRAPARLPIGTEVVVGLRPEKIDIGAVGFPATVTDVAYHGDQSVYRLALPGGVEIQASRQNRSGQQAEAGESVGVSWPESAALVFPK